jgi:hypothetical protein
MLIACVGAVPEYHIEQGDYTNHEELIKRVTFTEDINSIVTEVREATAHDSMGTVLCLRM